MHSNLTFMRFLADCRYMWSPFLQAASVVTHELLHALGMMHEQKRPDRDTYIDMVWSNIKGSAASQYYRDIDGDVGVIQFL